MFGKLNSQIENFYHSLEKDEEGKIVIPVVFKTIAGLLILVLKMAKAFTNDKIDALIDEIIEALEVLLES